MSDNIINNLLFIFKKDQKGNFEILYVSDNLVNCTEGHKNRFNCPTVAMLFPSLEGKVFEKIFNSILKNIPLELPLIIHKKKFIWVNLEGFICPTEEGGLIINALLKPSLCPEDEASWIHKKNSGNLFSNFYNGPNYHFKSLQALRKTLKFDRDFEAISPAQSPFKIREIALGLFEINLKTTLNTDMLNQGENFFKDSATNAPSLHLGEEVTNEEIEIFLQNILYTITKISNLDSGKDVFHKILNLIYEKFGFPYCIIAGIDHKTSEIDILSFVQNGKTLKTVPSRWDQIISTEISRSDKTDNLLKIENNISNHYPAYEILFGNDISSSMSMDILDKNNSKIGFMVFFDSKPIVEKPLFKNLFKLVRDCIGKELYRFKYEFALEETNFMHDAVLNGTAYAIFAVNHNLEIILINNNTLPVFNLDEKNKLMETQLNKGTERHTLAEIVKDFSQSNKETDYFLLEDGKNPCKELKISFTKIQLAGKNRLSYVIFVDDITDRTLSEKKLIASEQLFRSIAENFPKGTIDVLDKSFNYIYSDGEEYRLTGVDPKKLIGTHHLDKYSGENYKIAKHHLDKILKGETVSYEISNGTQKFLKSGVPLTNNLGEIDRILLVRQNITEANKLETEREKLIKDLKSHNEELLRFAYIVSHNLRAPIVNISLLLDLFNEDQPEDPDNKEVIENLKISTNLLDTTLQDLIEVVSIKKQKIPKVDLIDFKLLLNNVEKSLYNQLKESGITIHKDFSKLEEMNYVYAHMENFFMNFMTNSVKYKHPDRPPEVWISTYRENDYCVIRFEDNGIGLDLERYGDRLFGLYQRFHNHVEGKGLGLYLVREQIRVNDGKIEVESTVGKGTQFKIYLRNLIPTTNKRVPKSN